MIKWDIATGVGLRKVHSVAEVNLMTLTDIWMSLRLPDVIVDGATLDLIISVFTSRNNVGWIR